MGAGGGKEEAEAGEGGRCKAKLAKTVKRSFV